MYDQTKISELLWLLYSDVNTRLNILKEECAHLQNTIYSLSDSKYVHDIFQTKSDTGERAWAVSPDEVHQKRMDGRYSSLDTREKSYSHLVEFLGCILQGVDENKKNILKLYLATARRIYSESASNNSSATFKALFHFVAARGALVNAAIAKYTSDLEMAHEKLVQILENHAGNLPQPLLFRRWNSGLNEGFFSDYSRHLSWVTESQLVRGDDWDILKNPHSLIHTWTHSETSHFEARSISKDCSSGGKVTHSISLIRSAFFYLEQPVLLPLLYHEMAHSSYEKMLEEGGGTALGKRLVEARSEFIDALSATVRQDPDFVVEGIGNQNAWESVVGEIWCDIISVANGGRSYLLALLLQIFGQNGSVFYPIYNFPADKDALLDYDKFITDSVFTDNPGPIRLTPDYFWEARLLVAAWLLEEIHQDNASKEFASTVRELLKAWKQSGKEVLGEKKILAPQLRNWDIRCDLNEWLFKNTKMYLKKHVDALKGIGKSNWLTLGRSGAIALNEPGKILISAVSRAVYEYLSNALKRKSVPEYKVFEESFVSGIANIDDLALQARISVARMVSAEISSILGEKELDAFSKENKLNQWVSTFSDYCRHDGSTAFRMGLEAILARDSLMADILGDRVDLNENAQLDSFHIGILKNNNFDFDQCLISLKEAIEEISPRDIFEPSSLVACRTVLNSSVTGKTKKIAKLLDELMTPLMSNLINEMLPAQTIPMAQIGTFSLGYMRPESFSRDTGGFPCTDMLDKKMPSVHEINNLIRRNMPSATRNIEYDSYISPAVGDYSFVSYIKGLTPAEQDWHPTSEYRYITKPRVVLSVGKTETSPAQIFGEVVKDGSAVRSVCLVKFKYRWEWYKILTKLGGEVAQGNGERYSVALSSAWEDAVVLIMAATPQRIVEIHKNVGLTANCLKEFRYDTQSLLLPPKTPQAESTDLEGFCFDKFPEIPNRRKLKIFSALGRHDYVIAPLDERTGEILDDIGKYYSWLQAIPCEFWGQLSNYNSIVEWVLSGASDEDSSNGCLDNRFMFMLRVNLKAG